MRKRLRPLRRKLHELGPDGPNGLLYPLTYPGLKRTPARILNYLLLRFEQARGHTRLHAYPAVMVLESGNVCNLRCPACPTGIGEVGREKSFFPLPLYRNLIDELGSRLLMIEFYNWGEPLLHKDIDEMIAIAARKGISTFISTNLSLNMDAARAERLVASGLAVLGVSLEGATQESYVQYRVKGDFEKALRNVRLINEAKRRLHSQSPRLIWEFHTFPHNEHEVEQARATAASLDMEFWVSKGWVAGPDPNPRGPHETVFAGRRPRCRFLWQRAVVQNDGAVSPCDGVFYREDDFGSLTEPSVRASALATQTFRQAWNNENFVAARALFRSRAGAKRTDLICYSCPVTLMWHEYRDHVAAGNAGATYDSGFTENDGHNFFMNRGQSRADRAVREPPRTMRIIGQLGVATITARPDEAPPRRD